MKMIPHSSSNVTELDIEKVHQTLKSGLICKGDITKKFNLAFSNYLGSTYSILVTSGSSALISALKIMNMKKGDEVILPTYCCSDVWNAIVFLDLSPVLCDIGDDLCVSADSIKKVITPKSKAIIYVSTFGLIKDLTNIKEFGIPIIEDASHALSPLIYNKINWQHRGDIVTYSFQGTKCITTGEGGALAVLNERYKDNFLNTIATYIKPLKLDHLSDLSSSLGLSQLDTYDNRLARRLLISETYFSQIKCLSKNSFQAENIYFRFPVRTRDGFTRDIIKFESLGISVRRGVDALLHQAFFESGVFPHAEEAFEKNLCLPIYPSLKDDEINRIVDAANVVWK